MSNVALVKPKSRTGAIIVSGSIGTDTADDFVIKVMRARYRFRNPNEETTGDGDDEPSFDASNWGYCDFVLSGFMVSGTAFKIASLTDTTKNPFANNMKHHFASSQVLTINKALIEEVIVDFERSDANIGVVMIGKATDTGYSWATT